MDDGIVNNESELITSDLVINNMREYAHASIRHLFPSCIDGLISVTRRVIWQTYPSHNVTSEYQILVGNVYRLHVHSGDSIKNSMDVHSQPWKTMLPVMDVLGTIGTYSGDDPSAQRYQSGSLSKLIVDIYFTRSDLKTFPMEPAESGDGREPIYLIPAIPTALLNTDQSIAPGFKFYNLPLNLHSVCNLAKAFIVDRSFDRSLVKYMIPDSTVIGLFRNARHVHREYANGNFNFPIITDGVLEVTKNTITIKTIPIGNIKNVREKLETVEFSNPNSWFSKYFSEFEDGDCKYYAEHVLTAKRGVEPFLLLDKVKRFYRFTSSAKPFSNWLNVNNDKEEMNYIQIIEAWLKERRKSVLNQLRIEQSTLIVSVRLYQAMIIAIAHPKEMYDAFKGRASQNDVLYAIKEALPELTAIQIKHLFNNYKFNDITKYGQEEYEQRIAKARERLKTITDEIINVDQVLIRDIDFIQGKYAKSTGGDYMYKSCVFDGADRLVKIPKFIGVCCVRNIGYIQFFTMTELIDIIQTHGVKDVDVKLYPNHDVYKYSVSIENKLLTEHDLDFPQTFAGKAFFFNKMKLKNTVVLKEGKIYVVDELVYDIKEASEGRKYTYVSDYFTCINSNGSVERHSMSTIPLRKTADALGIITNICYVSPCTSDKFYIIYIDPSIPNVIRFSKPKNNKVSLPMSGEILYSGDDDNIALSVTGKFNKTNVKHLMFNGLTKIFQRFSTVSFDLLKNKFSDKETKVTTKTSYFIKDITVM